MHLSMPHIQHAMFYIWLEDSSFVFVNSSRLLQSCVLILEFFVDRCIASILCFSQKLRLLLTFVSGLEMKNLRWHFWVGELRH